MNKLKTNKKLNDVLSLIDMILKKQPKCLTIKMYDGAVSLQYIKILDIFKKYYIHNEPVKNYCYVCNSEHQLHLLESTCYCKSVFIHLYCLIELINNGYDECTICKKEYNPHIYRERYFFPFLNVYQIPLVSRIYEFIDKEDFDHSMYYAVSYLICDRVEELLENVDKKTFLKFKTKYIKFSYEINSRNIVVDKKKGYNFTIMFKSTEDKKYLMMNQYIVTGMNYEKYKKEHNKINELLKNKCIETE